MLRWTLDIFIAVGAMIVAYKLWTIGSALVAWSN